MNVAGFDPAMLAEGVVNTVFVVTVARCVTSHVIGAHFEGVVTILLSRAAIDKRGSSPSIAALKNNVIGRWLLQDDLTSSRVTSIVPLLEADRRVVSPPHTIITFSCSRKTRQHSQGSTGLSCARFEFDTSSLPLHDNVMMV